MCRIPAKVTAENSTIRMTFEKPSRLKTELIPTASSAVIPITAQTTYRAAKTSVANTASPYPKTGSAASTIRNTASASGSNTDLRHIWRKLHQRTTSAATVKNAAKIVSERRPWKRNLNISEYTSGIRWGVRFAQQ